MDFYAVLDEVVELVRSRGRVSHRALREQFSLDDERLETLRAELRYAYSGRIGDDGLGLVWTPDSAHHPDAERRQLTVLFCDLVDSTPLSGQLDPEDLREVMRAYYETCGKIITRFDGYIAQYLGDGLLVFFGYPQAHEDDAHRAVRAGLGIIEAIGELNVDLADRHDVELAVRLGCHTGLVVVGEVVGESRHELMAMGDTPNIAARLQGVAASNTLVIGAPTHQLLGGFFDSLSLGTPPLKGVAGPLEAYQVLHESTARTRLDAAAGTIGLTPLVGRAGELEFLQDRWSKALAGQGQVVLVTGEAGIGKSRLVHALTEHVAERQAWLTACQGSAYHRDTAFWPFIDLFERAVLRFERPESPDDKLRKLERFFARSGLPLDDALPGLCSLLSIPSGAAHTFNDLPPEQQKQQSMGALLSILRRRAERQPVLFVVEDLHWVDPTTVEFLDLLVENIHDSRILALFTCRPDFDNPWSGNRSVSEVSVNRLAPGEAVELMRRVAEDKALPGEIAADVVAKTDGVPLFIEELTKTLLESGLLEQQADHYELAGPLPPLAIPNTLHDSLMARLDRLSTTKALAQLGAAIGREFSYALIRAVSPWDEDLLQDGLAQLVRAEFLYQQGVAPRATYRFKHALIQDAAYQSLLKSTRQQHHQHIAAALEADFPEIVETRPELIAQHYTEAGLIEQAVPYWHAAGRRALRVYANLEATNHAKRGLELLAKLPDSPDRAKKELALQLVLGPSVSFVRGPQAVEAIYARARELARQVGGTPDLFPALSGLAYAQIVRGRMREARALADEYLELAAAQADPLISAVGHSMVAYAAWWQGDFIDVRDHSRDGMALYDPDHFRARTTPYNQNPGIICGYLSALANWMLGYPNQADEAMRRAIAHAKELEDPYGVGLTLLFAAQLAQLRRDPEAALTFADEAIAVSAAHGLYAVELWCLLPGGGPSRSGAMSSPASPISAKRWIADGPWTSAPSGRGSSLCWQTQRPPLDISTRVCVRWTRLRTGYAAMTNASTPRRRTGSRVSCCCGSSFTIPPRQSSVSNKRWPWPARSSRSPGSCVPPRAWPGSGCKTVGSTMRGTFSRRSTSGSPRDSTPPICRTRRRCWSNCPDRSRRPSPDRRDPGVDTESRRRGAARSGVERFPRLRADDAVDLQREVVAVGEDGLDVLHGRFGQLPEVSVDGPGVVVRIAPALEDLLDQEHRVALGPLLDQRRGQPGPRHRPDDAVDGQRERERKELADAAVQLVPDDPIAGYRTEDAVDLAEVDQIAAAV
jgi:class 3 adenylate cyclase